MDYTIKIKEYIDRAFASGDDSVKVEETKAELYADLLDKYNESIREGHSPQSAYHTTIGSIGDIFELVDSLTEDLPTTPKTPDTLASESAFRSSFWRYISFAPMVMTGLLLLFLLLDILVHTGPKSPLRGMPYVLIGLGTTLFILYLWMARQQKLRPIGNGIQASWYPIFVIAFWAVSIIVCLFLAAKPHLRRLSWIVLILTIAAHGLVNSIILYMEGENGNEKRNQ